MPRQTELWPNLQTSGTANQKVDIRRRLPKLGAKKGINMVPLHKIARFAGMFTAIVLGVILLYLAFELNTIGRDGSVAYKVGLTP